MPGALPEGYVLHDRAIAPDEGMRGNAPGGDLAEIEVRLGGLGAWEQPVDPRPAEFPGRQTDAVPHQQFGHRARRPRIAVRRQHLAGAAQESRGGVDFQRRHFNRPNTATPPCVPTNTLPSAIIGVMNLLPAPN